MRRFPKGRCRSPLSRRGVCAVMDSPLIVSASIRLRPTRWLCVFQEAPGCGRPDAGTVAKVGFTPPIKRGIAVRTNRPCVRLQHSRSTAEVRKGLSVVAHAAASYSFSLRSWMPMILRPPFSCRSRTTLSVTPLARSCPLLTLYRIRKRTVACLPLLERSCGASAS